MKGLALRTVILLVVAIIVMGIALWFLTYLVGFDALFLSNDQRILAKYSTCALALCANGYHLDGSPSGEVNAVGCLESKGGQCVLTCSQVKEKIFDEKGINGQQQGDRRVFCSEESKLDFQFTGISLGGTVPLVSGQMDRIANPAWLCKPVKIANFFVDDLFGNPPGLPTIKNACRFPLSIIGTSVMFAVFLTSDFLSVTL